MLYCILIMIFFACGFTANCLTIKNVLITVICTGAFIIGEIIYIILEDEHETEIKELQKEIEEIKKEIKK